MAAPLTLTPPVTASLLWQSKLDLLYFMANIVASILCNA